ncbi:MAG: DUF1818 family protein [Leptolyngbya sp. SIO1D8]|nr:DUF1818 family protein [Leptolyngbya sp. SIO1D8]
MAKHLKEGKGWRLGLNLDVTTFKGLVGGDNWAVEMTAAEFNDFCCLTLRLVDTLQAMSSELMDEERLVCEQETDYIWVEVEGYPNQYSLRFILLTGRKVEGGWSTTVTSELVQTLPSLTLF